MVAMGGKGYGAFDEAIAPFPFGSSYPTRLLSTLC